MSSESAADLLDPDAVFTDFGEPVRKGYAPEAVDAHLRRLAEGVRALRSRLAEAEQRAASAGGGDNESLEMVLQAARRSVEEALAEARARAAQIVAEAEDEARRTTDDAVRSAERTVVAAENEVAEMRAEAQRELASLDRMIEERRQILAGIDAQVAVRERALRAAAADLTEVADSLVTGGEIDLRERTGVADPLAPGASADAVEEAGAVEAQREAAQQPPSSLAAPVPIEKPAD